MTTDRLPSRVPRLLAPLALAAALALAGCTDAGGGSATAPPAERPASVAPTDTPTPTPATSPTAAASDGATGDPAASGDAPRCAVDALTGSIAPASGPGGDPGEGTGMSQQRVTVVLTNSSASPCTVQGWPGVSFVGDRDGTQLGLPATLDRGTDHPTVTLEPGASAQAPLHYTDGQVYPDAECGLTPADGLRVYPPGSTASLFVAWPQPACSTTDHALLEVGGFVAS
ncbi:DUF4232 domain-containing protein [Clavibacter michiganensis subsp. phaseoli]|uniref:DUF4232 domain-containing protein n=1 Tax=Clavibacter phaseoli TaxID=1734031 RepID=UPI001FB35F94|nr:DUF4232 domain-containing protein [Clavibacter phaseoli]MCJ1710683.1 DUF4232 domain-containing protein [Clavibacter phaseoli]